MDTVKDAVSELRGFRHVGVSARHALHRKSKWSRDIEGMGASSDVGSSVSAKGNAVAVCVDM